MKKFFKQAFTLAEGAAQDFCHSEYCEMYQISRHSESLEASPSILSLNSSTLKTLPLRHIVPAGSGLSLSGFHPSLCSHLSGIVKVR